MQKEEGIKLSMDILGDGYKFLRCENKGTDGKQKYRYYAECPNGQEFSFTLNEVKNGKRCKCGLCDPSKVSEIGAKKLCFDVGYTFVSYEKGSHPKVSFICKNGSNNTMSAKKFMIDKKCNCSKCRKYKKITEEVMKNDFEKFGYKYMSSVYESKKHRCNTICPNGNEYIVAYSDFMSGSRCTCRKCIGKIYRWNDELARSECIEHGFKYVGLSELEDGFKAVTYECKNGNTVTARLSDMVKRNWKCGCEICSNKKYTKDVIVKQLNDYGYKYIKHYIADHATTIDCICPKGSMYTVKANDFFSGIRCRCCTNKSKGELFTSEFLKSHNYVFKAEVRFDDCKNKNTLPFDFCIYDENDNVLFIIEYDGEGHYHPTRFNGISNDQAILNFEKRIKNDEIKTEYCKRNNIPLIRVPYTINTKNEIYDFLRNKIKKIGVMNDK